MEITMPTAEVKYVDFGKDDDGWQRTEWDVKIHYAGRCIVTKYFTGTALGEPTAEDVLYSLFLDAESTEYESVDEWVENFGLPIQSMADARKYERQYAEIERQSKELRALLGDDYEAIREALGDR